MARENPSAVMETWHAEEELLADIDHFRTDYLHNNADSAQLMKDVEAIDKLEGRLEPKLLKRIRKELKKLAKIPQRKRDSEAFHEMIHTVLEEQVKTRHEMGQ